MRGVGGVVLGYVAMAIFVFISFSLAYLLMGAEGAFQPGSYEVTTLWISSSMLLGFLAAVVGGFICSVIAKSSKATMILAGLVLVLGLAMALPLVMSSQEAEPAIRTGEVGNFEAMQRAQQPAWVALLNPLIGVVGVILGARLKRET